VVSPLTKLYESFKENHELSKRFPAYLKDDSDFGNGNIQTFQLPSDIWNQLSRYLRVTDIVHLSKTCKAWHTAMQGVWNVQQEKWGVFLKKDLHSKWLFKKEFYKVHFHCQKLFIDIFGVERILEMPCPSISDGPICRTADFKTFSVRCKITCCEYTLIKVILRICCRDVLPDVEGIERKLPKIEIMSASSKTELFCKGLEIQYEELKLKKLFQTGSTVFTYVQHLPFGPVRQNNQDEKKQMTVQLCCNEDGWIF
jgi:hypothetical protein